MQVEVQKKMVRRVTKVEVREYHLVLCQDEANILVELLGSIAGNPETTYRGVTSSMREQLESRLLRKSTDHTYFKFGHLDAQEMAKARK